LEKIMAKTQPEEIEAAAAEAAAAEAAAAEAAAAEAAAAEAAAAEAAAAEAAAAEAAAAPKVEALVLRDCGFGKSGEVILLSAADCEAGKQHGMLDPHPDAIKAAKNK
jgi:hypothetical protein